MEAWIYLPVFILGLLVGSFLNVVILRWNTGMAISRGRSACFSCGKTLSWHELIPVLSFVAQKGRCRSCGTKISWQYPLVELLTGLIFVLGFISVKPFLLIAALLSLYVVIAVYDLRHQIIPDTFSYGAACVALGLIGWQWHVTGVIDLYQVIAGPTLFIFFWFFWAVSRGSWMGLGDAKLALSVGWALGLSAGIAALLLSFWTGAIVSLVIMVAQRIKRHTIWSF
ncbi:MAG TPA: prepilin peptidase, partial [Candidatus Paceibacterota bacterium]